MLYVTNEKKSLDEKALQNAPTTLEMPALLGMPLAKAIGVLNELGIAFEIDGDGANVTNQFPAPSIEIFETDTVVIGLG